MNDLTIIQNIVEFMKRADLKGAEVPAFVAANNWLDEKYQQVVQAAQAAAAKPVRVRRKPKTPGG